MSDYFHISGESTNDNLCCSNKYNDCKQFCETDKLYISKCKPPIKDIIQVFSKVTVTSFKIITTKMGKKLIVNGCKHIKIHYTSYDPCSEVLCEKFDIPFCNFIILNKCTPKVCDVVSDIEYYRICKDTSRCLYVSMIIILCPKYKSYHDEHCKNDCYEDTDFCCNNEHCKEDDCMEEDPCTQHCIEGYNESSDC